MKCAVRPWLPAIALLALTPAVARAGNGDGVLLGNEAAATGGAVAAVVHDGSAAWYNPAGLAAMNRDVVDVSGSIFVLRTAEEVGLISATTGEATDGGYLELISIPSANTIARRLEPGITLAFGIFAPRFSRNTLRTDLSAGADPTTARWALSSSSFQATYQAGGAIGIAVDESFRIGVSIFGVYREFSESFQLAGAFQRSDLTRIVSRGELTHVRSFGLEIGLGLQWDPNPGVSFGLTFRSPGLEILTQVAGSTTSIDVTTRDALPDEIRFEPNVEEDLATGFVMLSAGRMNLAIAHRFDQGWVAAEIDAQPPLEVDGVLRRAFVWNVRVGGRFDVDDQLSLGAGFFTDQSERAPVDGLGETRIDFYGFTLGFEFRTPHELDEDEHAQTLEFSTTVALRYAAGIGEVGGFLFDPEGGIERATVLVGTTVHEVGIHIGSALYF